MTKGNTEPKFLGALVISDGSLIGEDAGEGDCFLDSMAQGINELCIPEVPLNVKSLRRAWHDYAERNQDAVFDSRTGITLRKAFEDSSAGICSPSGKNEYNDFASYLVHIQLTAEERAVLNLGIAMWGRLAIEGRILCHIWDKTTCN
jgi:hypothetical protein